jgi:cystathionine beta-lyase/cystathionine gamma-synthase
MKSLSTYHDITTEIIKMDKQSFVPMSPEIVQTTSFYYDTYEDFLEITDDEKNSFVYTRGSNPTTKELENMLAKLENGEKAKVFGSGMGAISATLLTILKHGDHVLMLNTVYGTALSLGKYLDKFGVEVTNVYVDKASDISQHVRANTRAIYFESPSSQHFTLLDLEEIGRIAKENDAYSIIDGTWASPLFQKPLDHSIDLVVHSLTKYVGGHSDLLGGVVIGKEELVDDIFEHGHQLLGSVISPLNSWLAIRGLRTLPVRMEYHSNSVKKFIDAIKDDERIHKIYHPYAGDDYQQRLAKKYLTGYGSLLSLEFVDEDFDKIKEFVNMLDYFSIGVSWGGFESLVLPSFKGNNTEKLNYRGFKKSHIRLYIGLEDPDTLIKDFKDAMDKVYGK